MRLMRAAGALGAIAVTSVALLGSRAADDVDVGRLLQTRFGFSAAQVDTARRGHPVAVALPAAVEREIVVGGAVRVDASGDRLLALLRDVERLESGEGFLQTRRVSDPPRLEDFDDVNLPAADIAALRRCRPGRCDVKLGQGAFDLLGQIDWNSGDATARVNSLARRTSLSYIQAYRKGGNAELAIYLDSGRPQFIATEFAEMVDRARIWPDALGPVANFLMAYPMADRPAGLTDFFYWSLAEFGLKPVLRLNHVVVFSTGRTTGPLHAVAVKQLYASHYFHTALEIRAVVADGEQPTRGTFLVILNMARSDGLTGVFGGLVKSKARSASRNGLERAMAAIKRMAEAPGPR